MDNLNLPFVSIVTPVYNGEKYLSECIESVLEQTYANWEYIILNNCSTDNTLQIAEQYAEKDDRIKVLTTDEFLKQIPNWNESLRKISSDSKYCKVVHADDCIFPECIEKLVSRAEEYPTAGVVSSYRFSGTKICGLHGEGLPYATTFLTGKKAGKMVMENRNFLFGTPTTVLYRSNLVRDKDLFYNPTIIHADTNTCFELMQVSDFAFVHQPLSFSRLHNESTTTFCDYYNTYILHDLYAIKTYGNFFLTSEEQEKIISRILTYQARWLVKSIFNGIGKDLLHYHKKELEKIGLSIDWHKFFKKFVFELVRVKPSVKWALKKYKLFKSSTKSEVINKTIHNKKRETVLSET